MRDVCTLKNAPTAWYKHEENVLILRFMRTAPLSHKDRCACLSGQTTFISVMEIYYQFALVFAACLYSQFIGFESMYDRYNYEVQDKYIPTYLPTFSERNRHFCHNFSSKG